MKTSAKIGFIMSISALIACCVVFIALYIFSIENSKLAEAKLQDEYVQKLTNLDVELSIFEEDIIKFLITTNKLNNFENLKNSHNNLQLRIKEITIENEAIDKLENNLYNLNLYDEESLISAKEDINNLRGEINKLKEDIIAGKFKVSNNLKVKNSADNSISASTQTEEQLPFKYGELDCRNFVLNLLKNEDIKTITLKNSDNNAYNYEIELKNKIKILASVSNQTKRLLNLNRINDKNLSGGYSIAECALAAKRFARAAGIEVETIETTKQANGTINVVLAPIMDKTIIYVQSVIVEISSDYLQIINFDAKNFEKNYKENRTITLKNTVDDAKKIVNKDAEILESKTCIISILDKEYLAFEFKLNYKGYIMYQYIDAAKLSELTIKSSRKW